MNVPDERLAELAEIFRRTEAGAIDAGVITFADAVEAALPAVLERHRQMIAEELEEANEACYLTPAIKIVRGEWNVREIRERAAEIERANKIAGGDSDVR
jgi:hypothetical protein